MKNKVELLASYWTISCGFPHTDKEYSPFDFRDPCGIGSQSGFYWLWNLAR
ncbi:MAG: hypothetical protein WAK89_03115 [Candidatus Sulfotelmatobacter sp.]